MLGGADFPQHVGIENERTTTVAQVERGEPLELVALGHARETSGLTITGTVRNPASGISWRV